MYNIINCCTNQLHFKSQAIKILIAQSVSRRPIKTKTEITWNCEMEIHWLFLDISMPKSFGCITQTSTLWSTEILRSNGVTVVYGEQPLTSLQQGCNTQFHFISRLPQEGRTLVIPISVLFLAGSTSYKTSSCLCS